MGTRIQILYLGVLHKLQMLVIQNILSMGESRDMSRIYIALQGYLSHPPFFIYGYPAIVNIFCTGVKADPSIQITVISLHMKNPNRVNNVLQI